MESPALKANTSRVANRADTLAPASWSPMHGSPRHRRVSGPASPDNAPMSAPRPPGPSTSRHLKAFSVYRPGTQDTGIRSWTHATQAHPFFPRPHSVLIIFAASGVRIDFVRARFAAPRGCTWSSTVWSPSPHTSIPDRGFQTRKVMYIITLLSRPIKAIQILLLLWQILILETCFDCS